MASPNHSPTPAQVHAINNALKDLSGITRGGAQDLIRGLPGLLREDELPEKMLWGQT